MIEVGIHVILHTTGAFHPQFIDKDVAVGSDIPPNAARHRRSRHEAAETWHFLHFGSRIPVDLLVRNFRSELNQSYSLGFELVFAQHSGIEFV